MLRVSTFGRALEEALVLQEKQPWRRLHLCRSVASLDLRSLLAETANCPKPWHESTQRKG